MKYTVYLVSLGALTLIACKGDTLTVGTGTPEGGAVATDEAGSVTAAATPFSTEDAGTYSVWTAPPGATLSAGPGTTWTGSLENYSLPSGSDTVTMTLDIDSSGTVTGTTYFGGLPLLDPPTDPDVGYPVAISPGDGAAIEAFDPIDNFPYTILGGHFDGARLTFTLQQSELWTQWCEIQTVYTEPNGAYGCLQGSGIQGNMGGSTCSLVTDAGAAIPVDCVKMGLCGYSLSPAGANDACWCMASGCTERAMSTGNIAFDMVVSGTSATGTAVGLPVDGNNESPSISVDFKEGDTAP